MNRNHLLVVDDQKDVAKSMAAAGRQCGFEVTMALNRAEFEAALAACEPLAITLDLGMADCDGVELLRLLAARKCPSHILLISGMDEKVRNTVVRLGTELKLNMLGTLQKPVRLADLKTCLQKVLPAQALTPAMLATAIAQCELVLHYQPQVTLGLGHTLCGVEALLRWRRPGQGLIPPSHFIPLAEASGLITPLTHYVLETALHERAEWRREGLDLCVSVNLSPLLLTDLSLPDRIEAELKATNTAPAQLKLEITETGTMQDPKQALDILSRFRIKGIALSMDDFGTGYSSLVQLYRLPFSQLKIDMSFIRELDRNPEARKITEMCINLASALHLDTCAEGVETAQVYRILGELGCTMAQGYYISAPLPAPDIPVWVSHWRTTHRRKAEKQVNAR